MGKLPTNSDGAHMSDVALDDRGDVGRARGLIMEIAGHCWRGRGDMLDRVHDAIREFSRVTLGRETTITKRRVRAWFHREAAGVRFHEMIELARVAQAARDDRLILEAKRTHADFIAETARIVAMAQPRAAVEYRRRLADQSRLLGGMDRAGNRTGAGQ